MRCTIVVAPRASITPGTGALPRDRRSRWVAAILRLPERHPRSLQRELLAIIEGDPEGQSWAAKLDMLLRALHVTIEDAKVAEEPSLDPWTLAGYRAAYEQIIVLGHQQNPPGTIPTGKRGVIKQTPARNLLIRLDRDREQVLRFAHDFRVPFDNNLAERDIRMIKIQQKVSGCWRTTVGADRFLALRA
jgi:transposase